jgi:hypothetical protein
VTLVIIFGPPAVGKMTVGLELERLTGFRLLHNHMTVGDVDCGSSITSRSEAASPAGSPLGDVRHRCRVKSE